LEFAAESDRTGKLTRCCRIVDLEGMGRHLMNTEALGVLKTVAFKMLRTFDNIRCALHFSPCFYAKY
jgi:hypothetical protein